MIEPIRRTWERSKKLVVLVTPAQSGKTEAILDLIAERLLSSPAPILYVGPNKQFLEQQFHPRIEELLEVPAIKARVSKRRMPMTRKIVNGQPLNLRHAGSSTALKSDPASLALTDEADELMRNLKGQGDPIGLVNERGTTYDDFVHFVVSTPSVGPKEVEVDPVSGLRFWSVQDPKLIKSKIWELWQQGTRHHWAWPCPHCGTYFVPRFECLDVGADWRKVTPKEARDRAVLVGPCGCVIEEDHKASMNARGVYVAPGQTITADGEVVGDPPDVSSWSYWVSGLASPFRRWADMAEAYAIALRGSDQDSTPQTVINAKFGELYSPSHADAPAWEEVRRRATAYGRGEVPQGVLFLTAGIDVQKNRLVWVIRGWGRRQESWLIDSGELWGDTSLDDVWVDASNLIATEFDGIPIRAAFVDAGFRPGKPEVVPEHKVYEWARRHRRHVWATKGYDHRSKPISFSQIDVKPNGQRAGYGLELAILDAGHHKSWVHSRILWPEGQPGGWHLYADIGEDYCRQIVAEAEIIDANGKPKWVSVYRDNHFLDAEALAFAAACRCGVLHPSMNQMGEPERAAQPMPQDTPQSPRAVDPFMRADPVPARANGRGGFLGGGGGLGGRGGWLGR